jgi:hypothetical protein
VLKITMDEIFEGDGMLMKENLLANHCWRMFDMEK